MVPADATLTEAAALTVDESTLTVSRGGNPWS
ncbi:hypothetical protein [Nocardia sp. CA-119907]